MRDAHVVILACTQTKENVGMVDDAFLNATRDGCVLVNVARGGLFQPDAILRALGDETTQKKLAFVASDVAWEEPVNPSTRSCDTSARTSRRTWEVSRTSRMNAWARSCATSREWCTKRVSRISPSASRSVAR